MQNRRAADVAAVVPLSISVAAQPDVAFAPLAGESVLTRLVATLRDAGVDPDRIVVAVAAPLADTVRETLDRHLLDVRVAVAESPGHRAQCISAALDLVVAQPAPPTYALLCDIGQALTPVALCMRVIARLAAEDIVFPALPVTDSIKLVDTEGTVTQTLDRALLRAVQYPRGYPVVTLRRLLAERVSDQFDDLAEALRAGGSIATVEGDPEALTAEVSGDASFVEAVIVARRA